MDKLSRTCNWLTKITPGNKYIAEFIKAGATLIQALFVALLVTFLLLLLIESLWEESVSPYLSLNLLLIKVIITGVISVLTRHHAKQMAGEHAGKKDVIFIITAGLVGAFIIWYKTQEIDWLSYVISIVSGSLIVLLLTLIWQGEEGEEVEGENSQDN